MLITAPMTNNDLAWLYLYSPEEQWPDYTARWADWPGLHLCTRTMDGDFVAWGGISILWPGLGNAWLATTPLAVPYRWSLYRTIRWEFRRLVAQLRLHRVQVDIVAKDARAERLMRHLGWTREAIMAEFGPNREEYYLYRWLARDL